MLGELKAQNLSNILAVLLSCENATKADLVKMVGLGNSTVSSAINSLMEANLIAQSGKESSIGGRCSVIYRINEEYGCFIGAVLRRQHIEFVVTDCHNMIRSSWVVELDEEKQAISVLLAQLKQTIECEKNVLGIGIGLDGAIEFEAQIVSSCQSLNWQQVHLKEIIERNFYIFTLVDHYVNGAAIRENLMGSLKSEDSCIYYHDLSPNKYAVILNGNICRGKNNLAGQMSDGGAQFFKNLSIYAQTWDVERVHIVAEEKSLDAIRDQMGGYENATICARVPYDLAQGLAVAAQVKWFKSTYFLL